MVLEGCWCCISSGRRGEEGKGREVERGRKEEEVGERREEGKVECSSTEYES